MPTDSSNGRLWIIPETWNSLTPRLRNMYWPGMPTWVYHTQKMYRQNRWVSADYNPQRVTPEAVACRAEGAWFQIDRETGVAYSSRGSKSQLPWAILGTWTDFRAMEDPVETKKRQDLQASCISRFVMQGYTPDSAVEAVKHDDTRLLKHTGLYSVELLNPLIATGGGGGRSEKKTVSSTGGEKGVKPERMDQIPPDALMKIAEAFGYGAEKYADYNWAKGYEWSKSFAAMQRHLWAFWGGEDLDPESGLPHLAHAGTHIMFLLRFQDQFPQFDDRGPKSIGNNDDEPED